jgi:hypothetical protein
MTYRNFRDELVGCIIVEDRAYAYHSHPTTAMMKAPSGPPDTRPRVLTTATKLLISATWLDGTLSAPISVYLYSSAVAVYSPAMTTQTIEVMLAAPIPEINLPITTGHIVVPRPLRSELVTIVQRDLKEKPTKRYPRR